MVALLPRKTTAAVLRASASTRPSTSGRLRVVSAEHLAHKEWEAYEHTLQQASSLAQPVVRHCYGGPPPFGLGTGLVKHLEHIAWLPPLPDPKEQERKERKQRQHQLLRLSRNFGAPLDGLDEESRQQVVQQRLKFLLGKFWGLMHEKDRPWHYDTIVYLCIRLPKPARLMYRRLKAATLQRILAQRAQVEQGLLKVMEDLEGHLESLRRYEYQVLERGAVLPSERLDRIGRAVFLLQDTLATLMATLHGLRKQAWQLHDQDYTHYGADLQQLGQECRALCSHMQRKRLRYIRQVNELNQKFTQQDPDGQGGVVSKERLLEIARLGPIPTKGRVPTVKHIAWRYPPRST